MTDSPATRASLLVRMRDPHDSHAWEQFVDIYAPLIYGYSRKHGLQDADAADLVQEVLRSVAGAIRKLEYDAQVGSFRAWLFTITRNKVRDFFRAGRIQASGDSAMNQMLQNHPAADEEQGWHADYERRVFHWAAEQIRSEVQPATWQAFWQTAVEGQAGKQVADSLGMSLAAVYLAKSRVMARLKSRVESLQNDLDETRFSEK